MLVQCQKCLRQLTTEHYWKDASRANGLQGWCKACRYAWDKGNRDARKVIKRRHYLKFQDRHVEQQRRRRETDPEKSRQICRNWYAKNRDKGRALNRKFQLARRYGMTNADYDEMLRSQNGACAICGGNRSPQGKRLAVDHDHDTGAVRGLLCINCNAGLGYFEDSVEIMAAAIEYIKRTAARKSA